MSGCGVGVFLFGERGINKSFSGVCIGVTISIRQMTKPPRLKTSEESNDGCLCWEYPFIKFDCLLKFAFFSYGLKKNRRLHHRDESMTALRGYIWKQAVRAFACRR